MASTKPKAQEAPAEPEWDHSVLQKPIALGTQNVRQILHCMNNGSREVKDILLNECSILFECKVCRNLFRSLPNLLAHKRIYCTEHLCETMSLSTGLLSDATPEIVTVVPTPVSAVAAKPLQEPVVRLTPIDGNPNAVFQKVLPQSDKPPAKEAQNIDDQSEQRIETCANPRKLRSPGKSTDSGKLLNHGRLPEVPRLSTPTSVTTPEGPASTGQPLQQEPDTTPQILHSPPSLATSSRASYLSGRNDCDLNKLTCLNCDTGYTSIKTLYLHMVSLHSKTRCYYPCPFCKTTFVQMWGVTRHLVTVHKQSRDQIVQLRDNIRSGVLLRKSRLQQMTDRLRVQNGSPSDHQCSKCKRHFGRKSSCLCHEKFCILDRKGAPRMNSRKGIPQKKVLTSPPLPRERESPGSELPSFPSPSYDAKHFPKTTSDSVNTETLFDPEVSSCNSEPKLLSQSSGSQPSSRPKRVAEKKMNKDFINSQTLKWRSANKVDTHSALPGPPNKRISPAVERKILSIIDYDRLACLRCDRLFSTFSNLRRHAAIHLGYSRYQCTRCSYQSYNRSDCRSHIQRVHADAYDVERMIVHVPGEEERHPMATRFPRLDSLSTLVTRSGAYPKRPPPDHLGYCLQNASSK